MPFKKHRCTLGLGSNSMLPRKENAGSWSKLCREMKKFILVSEKHPEVFRHFSSFPTIVAERQRQLIEGSKYLIHPLSLFSLLWNSFMAIINLAHTVSSTFRLCYILTPMFEVHELDVIIFGLHILCLADVIVKLNTAFKDRSVAYIVMERHRVSCHYLRHCFIVDITSCLPIAYTLLCVHSKKRHYLMIAHLMPLVRIIRLYTVMVDLKTFMKVFTRSYIWHRAVRHAVLFTLTMHWFACLIYLSPVLQYYWNGEMPKDYCQFLDMTKGNLTTFSIRERYQKAMFISLAAFFGTGFSMYKVAKPDEIVINSLIILFAAMFMVYTIVFLLKIYMTKFSSSMRYHELMNQMEKYMRHKQFPAPLKKRVRAFYNYRYQERYFKEDTALECLSDQLRYEITLHTCHKLVDKVSLLEGLPAALVGALLACLRPEVYLPNDLVVRAGEIGDCMYFIANGTVAVYSLKGAEVCHLEDGAHFGEVALLMKDNKRIATIVAIEITEVYRLDGADFRRYVVSYQALYERVETLASRRMHETVLLDEVFRKEREKKNEESRSGLIEEGKDNAGSQRDLM